MAESLFMRAEEVAAELGVSVSYAYKLMQRMNRELQEMGCITMSGRVDRRYFHEKIYGTRAKERSDHADGSI